MAKYSQEFKLEVVQYYLSGFGKPATSEKFKVSQSDVKKWVSAYQQYGVDGLIRKTTKSTFTTKFKLEVVRTVISEGLSLHEASLHFGIGNKGHAISNWLKLYNEHGIEGLKPKPKGRPKIMPKPKRPKIKSYKTDQDKTQKELLEELEYLRAENAFLKKLRTLRLEQETQEQAEQQRLQDLYRD